MRTLIDPNDVYVGCMTVACYNANAFAVEGDDRDYIEDFFKEKLENITVEKITPPDPDFETEAKWLDFTEECMPRAIYIAYYCDRRELSWCDVEDNPYYD